MKAVATKREKEIVQLADSDGDSMAALAVRDMAEEDGLEMVPRFKRGDWVVIFTGAHYHCGQLLGEDHEYYALAAGSAMIHDTGDFRDFYGKGLCTYCEITPVIDLIRKGAVSHISAWSFERPCHNNDGRV